MKESSRKWSWGILSVLITLLLGVVDWFSGYTLNFFVFYFLPISIAAWFLGTPGVVVLAIFSSMVWFGADMMTGHIYPSSVYAVWNTMIRLISFLAIGWSVSTLRHIILREQEMAGQLRKSLSEIKVLESFLPICAQCKKIRNHEGVWQHLEVYIGQHTDTQFSHSYCPECYKNALKEADLLDQKA